MFVTKPDYLVGKSSNLVDKLYATCQITGWFNESIGSYTCTENCGPPLNYSAVMNNNFTGNASSIVNYGTTFRWFNSLSRIPIITVLWYFTRYLLIYSARHSDWSLAGEVIYNNHTNQMKIFDVMLSLDYSFTRLLLYNKLCLCRYSCLNPAKKIADLTNPSAPLVTSIITACMVNSQYSLDVTKFVCIGKIQNPKFHLFPTKS